MMHAYDDCYFEQARMNMAHMLDAAVHGYGYTLQSFYCIFLRSKYSTDMEHGYSYVTAGMSGEEIAYYVIKTEDPNQCRRTLDWNVSAGRSAEYWTGWALAYYQWIRCVSYAMINEVVPIDEVYSMYRKYHEMDISSFVEYMDVRMEEGRRQRQMSRLKEYRMRMQLSQSELAKRCDIPVRTIQQYEQGQKELSRASIDYGLRLARVLCCNIQDLIEY